MINHLSKSIALFFAKKNIISRDELDSYIYGFQIIFSTIFNYSVIVLIMIYTGKFIETVIYICSVFTLRHHTGGYHAKTPMRCCLLSAFVYILVLFALNLTTYTYGIVCAILLLIPSFICILKFAPIVHKNNPVSDKSLKYHKKYSVLFSVLIVLITIVFILIKKYGLAMILTLGMCQVGMSLLVEKNLRRHN